MRDIDDILYFFARPQAIQFEQESVGVSTSRGQLRTAGTIKECVRSLTGQMGEMRGLLNSGAQICLIGSC